MTLKTVEETLNDSWLLLVYDNWMPQSEKEGALKTLLTQDRQAILTALVTALEGLPKIYDINDKPHIPLDQAKAIVTKLLTPTV